MEIQHAALAVPGSAGDGDPSFDLSRFWRVTLQFAGITASSLNLMATLDGTNWIAIKTGLANGIHSLDELLAGAGCVKYLRVHTVSIAGGETPTVTFVAQSFGF